MMADGPGPTVMSRPDAQPEHRPSDLRQGVPVDEGDAIAGEGIGGPNPASGSGSGASTDRLQTAERAGRPGWGQGKPRQRADPGNSAASGDEIVFTL